MDFTFTIPGSHKELLNTSGHHYYVKHVYSVDEIADNLKDCKQILFQGDPFYLFDHFDTYFSVIECDSTENAAITNLMRSFDLLYLTVDELGKRLEVVLNSNDNFGQQDRNKYLNLTKMCLFVFVNTVKKIDHVVLEVQQKQQQNAQKKRGKQVEWLEQFPHWDTKRVKFLVQLYNIMQSKLENLWSPPVPEENFVNMLCDICYRTLEITHARSDNHHVGETVFQILGTAIKRYNHALNFPVRILQILRTSEHAATFIANGISLLYEDYGITSVFAVLIKDIVETLAVDSADTVVARNFSNFLMELSATAAKMMIPHLSELCDELLNCESYVLRNCILQIMGNAIVGELTAEGLSEEMKEARNEFLEHLMNHINDVSAHVRAKVLQIWNSLKVEDAVPLTFQLRVLQGAVERLEDKTATVRKNAVQLIKSFLEHNPFAPDLTLEELIKKHEEECKKMEELNVVIGEERQKIEELDKHWESVVPEILPYVEKNLLESDEDAYYTEEEVETDLVAQINQLLVAKKYKEAVSLLRRADKQAGNDDLRLALQQKEQCVYFLALLKSYLFISNGCKDSNEAMGTQIKTVQFLQDSIEFSRVIAKAVPKLQEFLLSKTNSDVFEAVDLFTTGYLFGIKGTETGMRQMLFLMWSSDKEKRDAVSNAYRKVLFTTNETGRAHAIRVIQNLSRFMKGLTYGHYTAMECLVKDWVAATDIDTMIIQVLFERFTMKLEGTTPVESRMALQLLIMCSQANASIASSNIPVIEAIGLGDRSKYDPRLFTGCLELLLNSIDSTVASKFYKRYEPEHPLVEKVITRYKQFLFHPLVPDFDRITIRTLEFLYHLCQTPDVLALQLANDVLKQMIAKGARPSEGTTATQQANAVETPYSQAIPGSQANNAATGSSEYCMNTFLVQRFVFMIGYMTMKEMIFLDIDVYNNMKYRQELTETAEKNKKSHATNMRRKTGNINMSAIESMKRLSGTGGDQQDAEDDLVGATAEDSIAESISALLEKRILYDEKALFAKVFPVVMEICKYPVKYRNPALQQAATLSLQRYMCVSSLFCATYMGLLTNILNLNKNIKIKCNIVVGLSDLTFRFPNVIEPWTAYFYSMLHDKNNELRYTAVTMLSHLILHEMIRVKGQIADLALCIVDVDDEIKNITRQFFKEISNKSNILYNVLPDIISKLSDSSLNLEEDKYRTIMCYILGLIQKDRHVETLVEKLCLRFPVSRSERQWRDIAYCLSLLTYNERSVRKLIDNLQHYKDKVQIDEVYQSFKLIIGNTSKLAKPELKAVIQELETRINECLEVREPGAEDAGAVGEVDDRATVKKSSRNKKKGSGGASGRGRSHRRRGAGGRGGRQRASASSSSSSESASSSSDDDNEPAKKGQQKNSKNKAAAASQESEEEEEEEESSSRGRSNRSKNPSSYKVIEESNSSEEQVPVRKRGRNERK